MRIPSSMLGWARPVRTLDKSRRSASMALSDEERSSLSTSSSMAESPRWVDATSSNASYSEEPAELTPSPRRSEQGIALRPSALATTAIRRAGEAWRNMEELDFKSFPVLIVDDEEDNLD